MIHAEIGLIGLGVMGSNLALNIADRGYPIAVWNRTAARTGRFFEAAEDLRANIIPCTTLQDLVANIRPPRPIIVLVQAGKAVDEQIAQLRSLLSTGDIIIDAGNANFRDTLRRFQELDGSGIDFLGIGISGGAEGARHGPSIMGGGAATSWQRVEGVLNAIAARYEGEPCAAWLGPDGAGHFVKTIHNGIEYADMQMIAEIWGIMRDGLGMSAAEAARVFKRWNSGRLNSYLIEITAAVLDTVDPRTNRALVEVILDSAGQKGTGRWAVIEAQMMAVPATAIEAAVDARSLSAMKAEREAAERAYGSGPEKQVDEADRDALLADLELALFAGKICAYAQGFAIMRGASVEFGWELPLDTVARIWRAGCIIRSQFLDTIAAAFGDDGQLPNLLLSPGVVGMMGEAQPALRRVASVSARHGLPAPALLAALSWFDGYRQGRGTASLIQGQRDYFGAHGFRRIDADGEHHGPWGSGLGS